MGSVWAFIANAHHLVGHDKAAALLGVAPGDRAQCLLCLCEAGAVTRAEVQAALAGAAPQRSGEWNGIQAGCVVHRTVATWLPAPAWWHHDGTGRPCPYLLDAPAPIPRDEPWICGRYGEAGKRRTM